MKSSVKNSVDWIDYNVIPGKNVYGMQEEVPWFKICVVYLQVNKEMSRHMKENEWSSQEEKFKGSTSSQKDARIRCHLSRDLVSHCERLNCFIIPSVKFYHDKKGWTLFWGVSEHSSAFCGRVQLGINYPAPTSPTHHKQVRDFPRVTLTHALAEPWRCDYVTVYQNKELETTSKAMNVRTTK